MYGRTHCRACNGATAQADCTTCKGGRFVNFDQPGVPLSWFTEPTALEWSRFKQEVINLRDEAVAVGKGPINLVDQWGRKSTVIEFLEDWRHYQPAKGELWFILDDLVFKTDAIEVATHPHLWQRRELFARRTPFFQLVDRSVQQVEVASQAAEVQEPTPPRRIESREHPGLFLAREGTVVTFYFGQAWEAYDLKTGQEVGSSDGGSMPPAVWTYIRTKVMELLPTHRRAAQKEAASPAREAAEAPQEASIAPIVGAEAAPVKEELIHMPIDVTNPAAVQAASNFARALKESIGIPELESRRKDLLEQNAAVERVYRHAEIELDQAKRELGRVQEAKKIREQELVLEAAETKGEDGKKRFTNAEAQKAGAVALRKTDEEYLALAAAELTAEQKLYEAERALADAKANQRAFDRAAEQLREDTALAAARYQSVANLSAEQVKALTTQKPAA